MLLSGRCCSQIFSLEYEIVEDVLRRCAGLLGLDEAEVLGSATLMHGTSVVTDLQIDLEAVITKFEPLPLLLFLQIFVSSGFSVHVLEEGMFVLVVSGIFPAFPLEKLTREQNSLYEVGGGGLKSSVRRARCMT